MTTNTQHQTVFVTGATGAMGLSITEALTQAGHDVLGVTRSKQGAATLAALGATPIEVDLFDRIALQKVMRGVDTVAHFATNIPTGMSMAKVSSWALNDRLRVEATQNLIAAAEANHVPRFIFESYYGAYPDHGDQWIDESLPLQPIAKFMDSLVTGEALVNDYGAHGGDAVNLRFARIYGPGRASDALIEMVRKRQLPIVGAGGNFVSNLHVHDVGTAVLHALTVAPGTYNVGDDEPMRQSELTRYIADSVGAPAPRHLPYLAVRLFMGRLTGVLVASQRISSRRFREATGWQPRYASAREGWSVSAVQQATPAGNQATVVAGR